jgi:hypothetical protein
MHLRSFTYFEIRLAEPEVVFRGQPHEAAPFPFSGELILMLHNTTKVKKIYMTMTGESRLDFSSGRWCI